MKLKRSICLAFISVFFILPMAAWAFFGPYGKLSVQPSGKERMSIEILKERWQDYDVYFAGPNMNRPTAIMFDPKDDDKKLVPHKWWVRIEKEEDLKEVLWELRMAQVNFFPLVRSILGPDKDLYGYMYTAWNHVLIKVVDDSTLWVDDIPLPFGLPETADLGRSDV